jgi:hypothetical protein
MLRRDWWGGQVYENRSLWYCADVLFCKHLQAVNGKQLQEKHDGFVEALDLKIKRSAQ